MRYTDTHTHMYTEQNTCDSKCKYRGIHVVERVCNLQCTQSSRTYIVSVSVVSCVCDYNLPVIVAACSPQQNAIETTVGVRSIEVDNGWSATTARTAIMYLHLYGGKLPVSSSLAIRGPLRFDNLPHSNSALIVNKRCLVPQSP